MLVAFSLRRRNLGRRDLRSTVSLSLDSRRRVVYRGNPMRAARQTASLYSPSYLPHSPGYRIVSPLLVTS